MSYNNRIYNSIILFTFLLSSIVSYAQLEVRLGETTTLSVREVSSDTYVWELYDVSQGIDFAKTTGSCPSDKAVFVRGNTGNSVVVKWLATGTYFYKITARNSCTNNLKIGKITVVQGGKPSTPGIIAAYDCDDEIAILRATDYTGSLLWNTGDTSETITVIKQGTYTLIQKLGDQQSDPASITVNNPQIPEAPSVESPYIYIDLAEKVHLKADGCSNGTVLWYSDMELTQKMEETVFTIYEKGIYNYYAVCKNSNGCMSPYTRVTVIAGNYKKLFREMNIPQGFSPNGDGINDAFSIKDLKKYCEENNEEASISIFNRRGVKVYHQERYMLGQKMFEGYSQKSNRVRRIEKLSQGTYFYIIKFKGSKKVKKGFLYINY